MRESGFLLYLRRDSDGIRVEIPAVPSKRAGMLPANACCETFAKLGT